MGFKSSTFPCLGQVFILPTQDVLETRFFLENPTLKENLNRF